MKLNKLAMVLGLGVALTAGAANAADQGHGKVRFHGSIVDAPCTLKSNDINVYMGEISNQVLLAKDGASPDKKFKIELEGCTIATKKEVRASFDGMTVEGNKKLLAISGTAKGAGIEITPVSNNHALALDYSDEVVQPLLDGNNDMDFTARVKRDGTENIVPGTFEAIATFALNYQ
ncbi:MAG: type 1 fimbrial protein [Enterobacteriaceae bacterium]|jgi:type 1 fimbria pilin|nr:type 1 fimbrial protein [Enterobacteriaceae bacterium]